jgi:hypothetical protein
MGRARSTDDYLASVSQHVGAHPHDQPSPCKELREPVDIACALARVFPVLFSVVFDTDLELLPPHVDAPPTRINTGVRPGRRPRSPGGRGQGDAANQPPFVVEQLVAVDEDAVDRLAIPSVQLG